MILFGVLALIAAALLIFLVVIQNSKGGGLSSTFAGGNVTQMLGARRSTEQIERYTWGLAIAVAALAFVANVIGSSGGDGGTRLLMEGQIQNQVIQNPGIQDVESFQTAPEDIPAEELE